ncbi:unnamed protein product [Adineta steineri]|uniref:F-box domain-containing protein n=1 Tax=Adineta steineri TaxID=433720 RepID=A0A814QHQ8_9BILA|nr:unnamed protein product [Adineta steineri]CAF1119522.1 unnamed protein product [Adineta steineri]
MPHSIDFLEQLPIELLHTTFDYLWANEIIYSFYNINIYINNIIHTYSSYRFNLQSIRKSHFDNICEIIKVNRVISLRLSDDDSTPNQSKFFFAYFHLDQFIRLRSLSLFDINIDSLKFIISNLNQLNQLRSLSIHCNSINKKFILQGIHNYLNDTQSKFGLITIPSNVLIQLIRLNLGCGLNFEEHLQSLNLRYLTLEKCDIQTLQMILSTMTQLIFLNICLTGDTSSISHVPTSSSLRWLTLKINELIGKRDLVNGNRWKILSKDLIKFNFKFHVKIININSILDSFRNSYWLLNKRWYVAYDNQCLFTVPYFAPILTHSPYNPTIYSTIPDNTIFYDQIKHLVISKPENIMLNHLHNVDELTIECSIFPELLSIVNLNRLKHLKLASLDNIELFLMHLNSIPNLSKLSVNGNLTVDFIEYTKSCRTKQIRTLEIVTSTEDLSYIIEGLIYLFPQIEHLRISTIHSRKHIIRLIDGFEYLLNASFVLKCSSTDMNKRWFLKPGLSIREVRRLNNGTFTCQFDRLSTDSSLYEINLWIGEQARKS